VVRLKSTDVSKNMSPLSSGSKNIYLLRTGFLLGLCLDPEDGGDMVFRNVRLSTDYMTVIFQKTELFITTDVKTSDLTSQIYFLYVLHIFPAPDILRWILTKL
jgi:hypothetical protein